MLRVSVPTTLTLAVLALGLCACEQPIQAEGGGTEEERSADEIPTRPWGLRTKQYVAVEQPLVSRARWDRPSEMRLTVNVLPSGDVKFLGNLWQLYAEEDERRANLAQLESELERHGSIPGPGSEPELRRLPLMLHADAWVHWHHVRDVLRVALAGPARVTRLLWSVEHPATRRDVRQEAQVILHGEAAPGTVVSVTLSGRWLDELERSWEVVLRVGSATWSATQTHEYGEDPGASLPYWSSARPHLVTKAVELRVTEPGEAVRWGHVAALLDQLLVAGARAVVLPQLGVQLTRAEPEDLDRDPFVRQDDPVFTPLIVVFSVVAVLLVFALTLAPLRGLRRRARCGPRG